jgi:hypothetical protein
MGRKELRVVSIPNNWRPPTRGRFEQKTMEALVDLGHEMGADAKSWVTIVDGSSRERARR